MSSKNAYDVIVIGGGPAGMMSAGRAAERGKEVLLLEKNESLGKKLLITGGGRCNVTNNKSDNRALISSFRDKPKALYSLFTRYGVDDTLFFFNSRGMDTKVEAEDRVFPATERSESVLNVLNQYITDEKVTIKTDITVKEIKYDKKTSRFLVNTEKGAYSSKGCIVATGGLSRPDTGSTGDGFRWLKNLGHTINPNSGALVPVELKDDWVKTISGTVVENVKITLYQDEKREEVVNGKVLFTHFGISGPTILNLSSKIGELIPNGDVNISIDLYPDNDFTYVKELLYDLLTREDKKMIKNSLSEIVPSKLVNGILQSAKVDGNTLNHSLKREDRYKVIHTIKGLPLHVKRLLSADKAIISAGGVDIREVNFQTMESRILPNLYIIGDLLDIDRPSGGYSLQICWSSGYLAGEMVCS